MKMKMIRRMIVPGNKTHRDRLYDSKVWYEITVPGMQVSIFA
jgi:hypothetical protein